MPPRERVDYEELEGYFRALAYANRLELVDLLRVPHALQDITLAPGKARASANPERPISRQAVMDHLDRLVEAGIVQAREPAPGEKKPREYVVNPRRLYHIGEEFRKLTTHAAGAPGARDDTLGLAGPAGPAPEAGPRLVLVHGLLEGKQFPLRRADLAQTGRGWVLGRKEGLQVTLAYDPYVSLENSEILPEGGRHVLLDLRTSKNGTTLNWRRLATDERVALRPGDVVGVGRSLLVFRDD